VTDLRFVGIDGPRWLVRAVYQGRAAVDPQAAAPLTACLQGVVVERGREAMPVREALPLRLPREVAEQVHVQQAEQAQAQQTEQTHAQQTEQTHAQQRARAGQSPRPANGTAPRRRTSPRRRSG
jgi:hypothetical protein